MHKSLFVYGIIATPDSLQLYFRRVRAVRMTPYRHNPPPKKNKQTLPSFGLNCSIFSFHTAINPNRGARRTFLTKTCIHHNQSYLSGYKKISRCVSDCLLCDTLELFSSPSIPLLNPPIHRCNTPYTQNLFPFYQKIIAYTRCIPVSTMPLPPPGYVRVSFIILYLAIHHGCSPCQCSPTPPKMSQSKRRAFCYRIFYSPPLLLFCASAPFSKGYHL